MISSRVTSTGSHSAGLLPQTARMRPSVCFTIFRGHLSPPGKRGALCYVRTVSVNRAHQKHDLRSGSRGCRTIILHQSNNDTRKRLIVLDASVLLIRVLLGVLISYIRRNLVRDTGRDQFPNAIGVLPINVAEEIVEAPDDVRKQVKLGFRFVLAAMIAVHVDGFENAFGEVVLAWSLLST